VDHLLSIVTCHQFPILHLSSAFVDSTMSWGSYFKGAQDFLSNASATSMLEKAKQAAQEVAEAANKVSETVQEEYRKTFVDLDCKIMQVREKLQVMEFPSEDKIDRLSARLNHDFAGRMMIFNMSERKYDTSKFQGEVVEVAFKGLPSPPLEMLLELCLSAHHWLSLDERNILVVHCFSGYQRSCVFLSCFMAFCAMAATAVDALHEVCTAVGVNDASDILPSQRRYLAYFQQVQQGIFPEVGRLHLLRMQINGLPKFESENNVIFRPYIEVWNGGGLIYTSLAPNETQPAASCSPDDTCAAFPFPEDAIVSGDVLIRVRHVHADGSKETALRFAFHTGFVADGLQLAKHELDSAAQDGRWSADSFLDLVFMRIAAGDDQDSIELPDTLSAVYEKACSVSRKLAAEEKKRQQNEQSAGASSSAKAVAEGGMDEFSELEEALRRAPGSTPTSDKPSASSPTTVLAPAAASASNVAPAAEKAPPAAPAAASMSDEITESGTQKERRKEEDEQNQKEQEQDQQQQQQKQQQQQQQKKQDEKSGVPDMDDLFNDFDAALASFDGGPAKKAPAPAASPSAPQTEAKKANGVGKKGDDDVFGDVDAFLADLDKS